MDCDNKAVGGDGDLGLVNVGIKVNDFLLVILIKFGVVFNYENCVVGIGFTVNFNRGAEFGSEDNNVACLGSVINFGKTDRSRIFLGHIEILTCDVNKCVIILRKFRSGFGRFFGL